jgi:transcription elongation factor Elf1
MIATGEKLTPTVRTEIKINEIEIQYTCPECSHTWTEIDYFDGNKKTAGEPCQHCRKYDYYKQHEIGIECIDIFEWCSACTAAALKYLWRSGKKDDEREDMEKCAWYIRREIRFREWLNQQGIERDMVVPEILKERLNKVLEKEPTTQKEFAISPLLVWVKSGHQNLIALNNSLFFVEAWLGR